MRRPIRIVLWSLLALFALVVIVVVGGVAWLRSGSGLAYVVRTIESVASMPGMQVKVVGLTGSLPLQARIDELRVLDRDGAWLIMNNVAYDVDFRALFSRRLLIHEVSADEIAIARAPISEETQPKPEDQGLPLKLPAIELPRLPVAVMLDKLNVGRINLAPEMIGTPVAMTVAGLAHIDAAGAEAKLDLTRLDQPGALNLRMTASGTPMVLALHLSGDEPSGAPLARLLGRDEPMPAHIELHGEGPLDAWRGRMEARGGPANVTADITFDQAERWRAGLRLSVEPGDLVAPEMTPIVGPRPTFALTVSPTQPEGIEIAEIRLDTPGLKMSGSGVLSPARLDFTAAMTIDDLAPFSSLAGQDLAGLGQANLRLGGNESKPTLTATVAAENIKVAEAAVGSLQGKLDGHADTDPGAKLRRIAATVAASAERITAPGLRGSTERAELSVAGETDADLATATLSKLAIRLPGITVDANGGKNQNAIKGTLRVVAEDIGKTLAMVMDPAAGLEPRGALTVEGDIDGPLDNANLGLRVSSPSLHTGIAQADGLLARGLKLDGKARWNGQTLNIAGLDLALTDAKASVKGSVTPETQKMALEFEAALARLGTVMDGLQGNIDAKGKLAGTFAAPSLDARVNGSGIVSGGIRVDRLNAEIDAPNLVQPQAKLAVKATAGKLDASLGVAVAQERDGMRLRDLVLEGGGARITGDGILTNNGQIVGRIQGKIPDLAPWSQLAGQQLRGSIDLDAQASAGRGQTVEINLNAQSIALGGDAAAPKVGRARINGRLQDLATRPTGQIDMTVDNVTAGAVKIATLKLGVRPAGGANQLGFTLSTTGSLPAPVTLQGNGTLNLAAPRRSLELTRLDGSLAGERLALRQPLRATESGDAWVLAPFTLGVGNGSLAASGRYDPRRVELTATVRQLALAFLSRLADFDPLLGTLDVETRIAGPLRQPTGNVTVNIRDAGFAQASPVGNRRVSGRLAASLVPGETRLDGTLTAQGTQLNIGGAVPVSLDLTGSGVVIDQARPLRVKVNGGADLGSLRDLIPMGEDRLTGRLALDIDVGGTMTKPVPRGSVTLSDARYVNQLSGLILEKLQLAVALNGDIITINRLEASDGERGHLNGNGRIDISRQPMPDIDINVAIDNFRVARRDDARVLARGNLKVVNSAGKAAATGEITITNAELRFPERLPPSIIVLDVTEVDSRKATGRNRPAGPPKAAQAAATALALDITILLPREIYVRGRGLDSEWNGRMHIGGNSARPIIDGNLSVVRGTLDLLNREFKLSRGSLTFDGTPEINPRIDILAETTAGGITAQVLVGGTPRALTLTLTATPPLPQDEVLARVMFDKALTSITPIQGLQLANAARQLAGGGGGFDVMDKLRTATGLSRLSINSPPPDSSTGNGLAGTTVSGGRYIADGVYVGVDQGTTGASTKAKVEIEVSPRITVDSTLGQTGQGIGLNYKFDY